jgi:lysozyme
MNDVQQWIKKCEALRLKMYIDTTGNPTIGWGRNLNKDISLDEAELMFQNDFKQAVSELEHFDWYTIQPQGVKNALINMNFNLGIGNLLLFTRMIAALTVKNYTLAAQEALNSKWSTQVGDDRAKDVAVMLREGK